MSKQLSISGKRVRLETFRPEHLTTSYIGWLNDIDVVRFSNQRFNTHTEETCKRYLESFKDSENLFLVVIDNNTNQQIGTVTAYMSAAHGTADVGILIGNRAFWGKGYGLEVWQLILSYLFEHLSIRKVTAGTVSSNKGMIAIMERSGMTLEGLRKQQMVFDDQLEDVLLYGIFAKS